MRLYFACGSTGTARYALLKNVVVKGAPLTVTATATSQALAEVQLYPNPTPDGHLTLALPSQREPLQMTISNALGQRVYAGTVPAGAAQVLDLSGLARGVYVLQGRPASGELLLRRLVRE